MVDSFGRKKGIVFITGANGMLGASIVRILLDNHYEVHALIFPGTDTSVLNDLEITIREGNLCDPLPLEEWISQCNYVIHVAASTSIWPRRNPSVWAVNYDATINLANAASKTGINKFIHIGTANSFAHGPASSPGTELGKYIMGKYKTDYMDSKYEVQQALLRKFKKEGFPVVIVNPTFMIGPFDSGPSSGRMILGAMEGNIPGYVKGGKNFVFSVDVAQAVVNAITLGQEGECYIAGGENLTYKEFFGIVFEKLGIERSLRPIPHLFSLLGGAALSLKARVDGQAPKLGFTMAKMSIEYTYFSNEKAVKELNMPTTPIDVAVEECYQWMKENGISAKAMTLQKIKTVIITGSTQGVGNSLAHAYAKQGHNIVVNGRSASKKELIELEFGYAGSRMRYIAADIQSASGAKHLIDGAIDAFGAIDILINNAGMSSYGDLEDSTPEVILEVLGSNATGSHLVTHFALPHLRNTRGSVLFISSLAGLHGLGGHVIYSAGKMAVIGLAQGLRKELRRHGVFVGYTCLGFTENDPAKRTLAPDGTLEPIPKRPGIKPATKEYAVRKIMRQIDRKQFRAVHTFPGKVLSIISRVSESLTLFIMQIGYNAERKFLREERAKQLEARSEKKDMGGA